MVPQHPHHIGPAIADALGRLDARLRSDLASCRADLDAVRSAAGVAALDAVREAADAVRTRLVARSPDVTIEPRDAERHR